MTTAQKLARQEERLSFYRRRKYECGSWAQFLRFVKMEAEIERKVRRLRFFERHKN